MIEKCLTFSAPQPHTHSDLVLLVKEQQLELYKYKLVARSKHIVTEFEKLDSLETKSKIKDAIVFSAGKLTSEEPAE